MDHWNLVSQKASFGGDLLGRHTWWHRGLLPRLSMSEGEMRERLSLALHLCLMGLFQHGGWISHQWRNCHRKTHASLFYAGLEQVSPPQRSQRNGSRKKPWKVPSLKWCFRICLTHDSDSLPLLSTSGKQPRIPQADSCFQLMEIWTNTTSTEEYLQTVANVARNTNQMACTGVTDGEGLGVVAGEGLPRT